MEQTLNLKDFFFYIIIDFYLFIYLFNFFNFKIFNSYDIFKASKCSHVFTPEFN